MRKIFTLLLIIFSINSSRSQTGLIKGFILDSESLQPIPYAHIFLSGTTFITITNEGGEFNLQNIPLGNYQLTASFLGYETYMQNLRLNASISLTIKLKSQIRELKDVVVKSDDDKDWKKNLKSFKGYFFGDTKNSKACILANPWILEFNKNGRNLKAKATEPLEIQNHSLGYRILFYLKRFEASPENYSIVGPTQFQKMNDPGKEKEWEINRMKTFNGSPRHFLQSLISSKSKESGFRIYESIDVGHKEERSPFFQSDLGTRVREISMRNLLRKEMTGSVLSVPKPIEVHYELGEDYHPKYKDLLHQVSWVQSTTGLIKFDSAGNILNPTDIIVAGYWNDLKVADMLPLDYRPTGGLQEGASKQSLVVLTDRDSYHPGETIWYSVLPSNQDPFPLKGRHSIHVDLLDSTNQTIEERLDLLEGGVADGFFNLRSQSKGIFFLRAYSTAGYNEGVIYMKPIVVVPNGFELDCNVDELPCLSKHELLLSIDTVHLNHEYSILLRDKNQDTLNGKFILSISSKSIQCSKFAGKVVTFPVEESQKVIDNIQGGRITGRKGKGLSGRLSLVATDLSFSTECSVDSKNGFKLDDLITFDSTGWIAQFYSAKDKLSDDFQIKWNEQKKDYRIPNLTWSIDYRIREMIYKEPKLRSGTGATESANFKIKDSTRLLNEVTVKASRLNTSQSKFRSYGSPQHVVKGEDIMKNPAGTNILAALSGRVPGLIVSEVGHTVKFSIRGTSSFLSNEDPLIILDGMPLDSLQFAYDILQTIPLSDIDRVEVRTGLSPLNGLKGNNGVIAIYTKRTGQSSPYQKNSLPNPFMKKVTLIGYSKKKPFERKISSSESTIYWSSDGQFQNNQPYKILTDINYSTIYIRLYHIESSTEVCKEFNLHVN